MKWASVDTFLARLVDVDGGLQRVTEYENDNDPSQQCSHGGITAVSRTACNKRVVMRGRTGDSAVDHVVEKSQKNHGDEAHS